MVLQVDFNRIIAEAKDKIISKGNRILTSVNNYKQLIINDENKFD